MYTSTECKLFYIEFHFYFISPPQHFRSPLQHALVEQLSSLNDALTTLNSNPHPSQENRWFSFSSLKGTLYQLKILNIKVCNVNSNLFRNNDSEDDSEFSLFLRVGNDFPAEKWQSLQRDKLTKSVIFQNNVFKLHVCYIHSENDYISHLKKWRPLHFNSPMLIPRIFDRFITLIKIGIWYPFLSQLPMCILFTSNQKVKSQSYMEKEL